ncbi:hypothetical protein HDV57DRAFT_156651 [Trichoderma longibrachiatum]
MLAREQLVAAIWLRYCLSGARLGLRHADGGCLDVLGVALSPCQSTRCREDECFDTYCTLCIHAHSCSPVGILSIRSCWETGDGYLDHIKVSSYYHKRTASNNPERETRALHLWQIRISLSSAQPGNGPPSFL